MIADKEQLGRQVTLSGGREEVEKSIVTAGGRVQNGRCGTRSYVYVQH